ncbi:ChaN family lipoprotein [Candidatus Woesearchaeota archaeon]|nr:ChaN family lipoprotein [Candidatus Woesearchaeota archaeon]
MTRRILKGLICVLIGYNCALAQIQAVGETFFSRKEFEEFEKTANDYDAAYFDQIADYNEICCAQKHIKNNVIGEKGMHRELKKERIVILADAHCFTAQHKKMIDMIHNVKRKGLIVGLESFSIDEQSYIDNYLESKIGLEELVESTKYRLKELDKYGYTDIYRFLKEKNIRFIGIDMPSTIERELITENSIELSISRYFMFNFYDRDSTIAKAVKEVLERGNDILIIAGTLHAESNHLPYMIKKLTSQCSAIVFQQPYKLMQCKNPLKEYERFNKLGLGKGEVLKIKGEHLKFYLNVKPNMEEWSGWGEEQ